MNLSLPQDFLNRMQEMLQDEFNDFLESYEKSNYQALRINRLKESPTVFLDRKGSDFGLTPVPWADDGFYYPETVRPGKHPYHEAGVYYIQEPSAMMPAARLEVHPGERVLDLCAAPGGKSTQIASAMEQQGILISNEIHPQRAKILAENIERMGIRNAIVTSETPKTLAMRFPSYFDRIMVDAPCSGEGMFRKNPQACQEWSLENVRLCGARQDEILDCAHEMLRPGGRMVFSTCTFAPFENEGSIERFLQRHPAYKLVDSIRLWPHKIKGEGHFVAILEKDEPIADNYSSHSIISEHTGIRLENNLLRETWGGKSKTNPKKKSAATPDLKELEQFLSDTIKVPLSGTLTMFGDQIYLLPENTPSLSGLRVLRPGLHLGSLLKNRFEPSHALALFLKPSQVSNYVNLNLEDSIQYQTACQYINGQTFAYEGEKGWYLICVDGYSLGWGKLAGSIMKNHYPKGLRKDIHS